MEKRLSSLHKILKDETRQKIIVLLNKKGDLSYTELMDCLEVVSTGLLNYHLKVLADLLTKDENGRYSLTEKGIIAYKVMTEFSANQTQPIDKRAYKAWIVFTIASVLLVALPGYFFNLPLERTLIVIATVLIANAFAIYIRIKPSNSGNRLFFIFVGASVLGFLLWGMVIFFMNNTGISGNIVTSTGKTGSYFSWIMSLIICWIIGGFIGDLIGRKMKYIFPTLKV